MVDHMETSRLAATAAFTHGMPNFVTDPSTSHLDGHQTTVYHAMPHGLRDGLRKKIIPESYVDISSVMESKRVALAEHKSQHSWLESSQGMNSYLMSMENMSRELGEMSGKFDYAEGWRRRSHLGFSQNEEDPLSEALQELYSQYKDFNFIVIGFPSNDFLWQEPGNNEDIIEFCEENYGVTFPMMTKVKVKGLNKHPLYQFLTPVSYTHLTLPTIYSV